MSSVVLIGGGAIGLATAYALIRSGREVTIVDRSALASGAARGNAGEVCPTELSPLAAPGVLTVAVKNSYRRDSALYVHPAAVPRIAPFLGHLLSRSTAATFTRGVAALIDFGRPTFALFEEMERDGIHVGLRKAPYVNAYSTRALARARRDYKVRTYPYEVGELLTGAELRAIEPALSERVEAGFLTHGQAHLDPVTYLDSLIEWLRRNGLRALDGAHVTGIREDADGVRVATSRGSVTADQLVITAGAGSRAIGRLVGVNLPIVAGKGYSFTLPPDVRLTHVVKLDEAYVAVVPMDRGVRVAGTMEFDHDAERFNHKRVRAIVAAARPYLRGVDWEQRTHEWVGPRPMTSDGLPIIDRIPGSGRSYVASGHNMLGLLLSPATGRAVADLLDGRPPTQLAPFALTRFPRLLVRAPRPS